MKDLKNTLSDKNDRHVYQPLKEVKNSADGIEGQHSMKR